VPQPYDEDAGAGPVVPRSNLLPGQRHLLARFGEPALHQQDFDWHGFEWIDCHDADNSVLSYLRRDKSGERSLIVVCNFTPLPRHNYRLGAPQKGHWAEMLNSDAKEYGGSGQGNFGGVDTVPLPLHGRLASVTVTLPPLGIVIFRHDAQQ
jgi:1,4-alpha-glucan branching enzyme